MVVVWYYTTLLVNSQGPSLIVSVSVILETNAAKSIGILQSYQYLHILWYSIAVLGLVPLYFLLFTQVYRHRMNKGASKN